MYALEAIRCKRCCIEAHSLDSPVEVEKMAVLLNRLQDRERIKNDALLIRMRRFILYIAQYLQVDNAIFHKDG